MRRSSCIAALALVICGWVSAATVQELNDMFARKDYANVVTQVDSTLTREGSALSDQDACTLMTLKAEALLRQGSTSAAVRVFEAAAHIAPGLEQLAWNRASAAVVRRSVNGSFTPRGGDKTAIDVMDPESRKKAFVALLDEIIPDVQRRQQAAMRDTTLPALENAVLPLSDACFLEVAATGEAKQMGPLLKDVGEHARLLIEKDLVRIQQQVSRLSRMADSYDPYGGGGVRGISSPERDQLRDLDAYLRRVDDRVRVYRDTAARMNGDTKAWDAIELRLVALRTDLEGLLTNVY